ncbi:MAG: hypothetical protein IT475_15460 [Aquimonas sp.]|nr:hypothetical protein [Aquimonas sp.]
MWRSGTPVEASFVANLLAAIWLILLKCALLVLKAHLLFAGSDQFAPSGTWFPDNLASIYPVYHSTVVWLLDLGDVGGVLAMQSLASAITGWLVFCLSRQGFGVTVKHALVIATLYVLDPAQLAAERTALPDALSRFLLVWMVFAVSQYFRSFNHGWTFGWLVAGAMLGMMDPALGWVVMLFAVVVPLCIWVQSASTLRSPWFIAEPWSCRLKLLTVLVFGALLAQSLAAVNARLIGPWDTAVQEAGAQRLVAWAPLLSPAATAKVGVDFTALLAGLPHLPTYEERAQHLYEADGLWGSVRQIAEARSVDPHRLARKLAVRGMQTNPAALITVLRESVWPSDVGLLGEHSGLSRRFYSAMVALGMMLGGFWVGLHWRRGTVLILPMFAAVVQCAVAIQLYLMSPDISLAKSAWLSTFALPLLMIGPAATPNVARSPSNTARSAGSSHISAWWSQQLQLLLSEDGLIRFGWVVVAVGVAAVTLSHGQDRNWDLLNYHLYNPLALWEGRTLDVLPAQLQSWYSPFLDLPTHLLATARLHGAWISLWLAVPAILAIGIVWRVVVDHTRHLATADRWAFAAIALVLLLTSSAGGASLGATFNEWPIAAAMVFALYILLGMAEVRDVRYRRLVLAALVAGAAAGLKLTALPYCVALGAAAAVALPAGQRINGLLIFGLSGLIGGLITLGPWAIRVWQATGNPLFPYYNQWFQSPDADITSYVFSLYRPETWWETVASPWHLATGARWFSELPTADARLLLGWLAVVAFVLRVWRNKLSMTVLDKRETILAVFFVVSYAGWMALHTIHRYTIGLELVAVLLLVVGLAHRRAAGLALGMVLMTLLQLVTVSPDWGRGAYTTPFAFNAHPNYPGGSVLASFSGAPIGYVAVGLPTEVPLLGLNNNLVSTTTCRRWQLDGLRALHSAKYLWTVQSDAVTTPDELSASRAYGVHVGAPCRKIQSSLQAFWVCPSHMNSSGATICLQDFADNPDE